eukprot:8706340-Pyramimonas_sp.AAC.1
MIKKSPNWKQLARAVAYFRCKPHKPKEGGRQMATLMWKINADTPLGLKIQGCLESLVQIEGGGVPARPSAAGPVRARPLEDRRARAQALIMQSSERFQQLVAR